MALGKEQLACVLSANIGFNKREAKELVDSFFEELRVALEHGEGVELYGFGKFRLRDKRQRPGRNPKTGEKTAVAARRVVTFNPSLKLKEMLAQNYRNIAKQSIAKRNAAGPNRSRETTYRQFDRASEIIRASPSAE